MLDYIVIPKEAGLQEHQRLLITVENHIRRVVPILTQYRINRANARAAFDDALSTAKILAIDKYELKPSNQTLINAYANADEDVRRLRQEWLNKRALEIKAKDRLEQLQGQRDTLKALVKSEHGSY